MYRNIDVITEMRKLTGHKPVQAMTGAGVLASQTIKDLPTRVFRWGTGNPVTSLPGRATGYVQTARARAIGGYDRLAARGKKALDGNKALSGPSHTAHSTSTQTTQGKSAANGKSKAPSSRTGSSAGH